MRILGVLKKPRFVGQVFNLNHTGAVFYDNTGRHTVSTGVGVTSVGGKATFAEGNGGVIAFNDGLNPDKDFSMTKMGDFDVSFKFQLAASDGLALLFAFGDSTGNTGAGIYCYVGNIGDGLKVHLVVTGLNPPTTPHPTIQVTGGTEQTVLITRRGLLYTLTVDGVSVSNTASNLGVDIAASNLIIGAWTSQGPTWDFVGTIRDFVVEKV